jgi:hypothetical protein
VSEKENPAAVQMRDDLQIIAERAHAIGCRGGGLAYAEDMIDLMRAGDRHMRTDPLTAEDITAGWWWARCQWNGDIEVVHIKPNILSEGFRIDISGTEEQIDVKRLLKEYELISRIPEPTS